MDRNGSHSERLLRRNRPYPVVECRGREVPDGSCRPAELPRQQTHILLQSPGLLHREEAGEVFVALILHRRPIPRESSCTKPDRRPGKSRRELRRKMSRDLDVGGPLLSRKQEAETL